MDPIYIHCPYNYLQLVDVLSVVSCAEIICYEYYERISKIFPLTGKLDLLKIIQIISRSKTFSMCLRYVLLIDKRDISFTYIVNVLATILRYLKHIILNILNCCMRKE